MTAVYHGDRRVWLPGRKVEELIGSPVRHETRPHGYTNDKRPCQHISHRRRTPGEEVYVWDEREGSPWKGRHEPPGSGIWVSYYTTPHPDVLAVWRMCMGDPGDAEFGLSTLRIIRWPDGRTVLIGEPVNGIGSMWLTIEESP